MARRCPAAWHQAAAPTSAAGPCSAPPPPPPPGHQTMRLPLLPSSHLPHAPNLPHAAGSLFGIVTKVKLQLYEAPTYSGAMVWKDDPEHVNYK